MFLHWIVIVGYAGLSACAASQQISLVASNDQESIVRNGVPALISKKSHVVMLRPNSRIVRSNARPAFTVVVKNLGTRPETLHEDDISARLDANGKHPVVIPVIKHETLVAEEKNRQAIQAVGVALSGFGRAMSASNAGYSTTTGSFSGSSYGSPTHGTYSSHTYDPYKAQQAQQIAAAQTDAEFEALRGEGERNLQLLNQTILKDHTVLPGEWYGGTIVLETPPKGADSGSHYTISVRFGSESHEFTIKQVTS